MKHRARIGIITLITILASHCVSTSQDPSAPLVFQPTTVIPTNFTSQLMTDEARVEVPDQALGVAVVYRPWAELRAGPGAEFPLLDQTLPKEVIVLVIAKHDDTWLKVLAPESGLVGWAHAKALTKKVRDGVRFNIPTRPLQKLTAVRTINTAYPFPNRDDQVTVNIGKGVTFYQIREIGDKALVLLPATQSLLWLAKKDAQ